MLKYLKFKNYLNGYSTNLDSVNEKIFKLNREGKHNEKEQHMREIWGTGKKSNIQ